MREKTTVAFSAQFQNRSLSFSLSLFLSLAKKSFSLFLHHNYLPPPPPPPVEPPGKEQKIR